MNSITEVNFCVDFLKLQNSSNESCIFSPIAMLNSLALVYASSDGNNAEQIANIFGKEVLDKEEVINYFSSYIKHVTVKEDHENKIFLQSSEIDSTETVKEADESVQFKIVAENKIIVDKNVHLLESFITKITEKFADCSIQQLNLKEEIDKIIKINFKSDEKINEIQQKQDDKRTITLESVVNCIGRWRKPFSNRKKTIFYSKIPREIFSMNKTMCCCFAEGEDWKCAGIPYQKMEVWMFIVLPNENDGLQKLINKIDYSMLVKFTQGEVTIVQPTIPVFEISTDFDLMKILFKPGINNLSDPPQCNLSNMIDPLNSHCIDKAICKASIKIDEYGSEVGPIRRENRVPGCRPKEFNADHPFMYFIAAADRSGPENEDDTLEMQKPPTKIFIAGTFY